MWVVWVGYVWDGEKMRLYFISYIYYTPVILHNLQGSVLRVFVSGSSVKRLFSVWSSGRERGLGEAHLGVGGIEDTVETFQESVAVDEVEAFTAVRAELLIQKSLDMNQ